jgi:hypothetical protein
MNPAFLPAIEALESELKKLDDELLLKKRLINQLYISGGAQPKYSDAELSSSSATTAPLLGDQFTGKPLATCVKWILEKRKNSGLSAIPLTELHEVLKSGGYVFDNKNEAIARRNVAITLGKNPAFMKVPSSGDIGLAEWYPGLKRKPVQRTDEEEVEQGLQEAVAGPKKDSAV